MVKPMVEKSPNALSVFTRGAQILDLRHGERGVVGADATRALADVDQPILVAVDQRAQQDAAHQREDGGVGADAEGQGEHHRNRESLSAGKRAHGELQVVKKGHDRVGHENGSLQKK